MKRPDESIMNSMSIKKWGAMFEIMTTVEEIGELLVELSKENPVIDELLGELADSSIMMGQLSAVFGPDLVATAYMHQMEATDPMPILEASGKLLSGLNKYNRARIGKTVMCEHIAGMKIAITRKLAEMQKEFTYMDIKQRYQEIREQKLMKLWNHLKNTPTGKGISDLD